MGSVGLRLSRLADQADTKLWHHQRLLQSGLPLYAHIRHGPIEFGKDIVALLHREIAKIIAVPQMKNRLATLGFEPVVSTPEEFGTEIGIEIERWGNVIRAAQIKAQ